MDITKTPVRPGVTMVETTPRPTPKPVRVHFLEVLAKTVVSGAESAVRALPGGPAMALALRGGSVSMPMARPMSGTTSLGAPEGPGGSAAGALAGAAGTALGVPGSGVPGVSSGTGDGGIESSLQQSQEMNLYFLQIQEEVNSQNRNFTALSNVLKTEHDTVKTAIGNIR